MSIPKKQKVRKEQILLAAERVFAKKGFAESTISDVAKETGVSDATIYEYFSSKEELLFSIPRDTIKKTKELLELHLNYIRGAANKIRSCIYHFLSFYENHPDFASISMLILKSNRKYLETDTYQIVRKLFQIIVKIVREGVDSGEFKPDIDPYLVRSIILGTIEHMVIRWLLIDKTSSLSSQTDSLCDLIIDGIKKDRGMKEWNLKLTLEPEENG